MEENVRQWMPLGGKTGGAWGGSTVAGNRPPFLGRRVYRQEIPLTPAPHHNSPYQDDRSHWGILEGGFLGLLLHRGGRGWRSLGG